MKNLLYDYKNFTIENHGITFGTDGEGALISIPFADDAPQSIKDKLNELICQGIDEWLSNEVIEGCIPTAGNLLLDARMQINYCYDGKPQYFIDVTITDLYPEIGMGIWIRKETDLKYEDSDFQNEFIAYCRYRLDRILFFNLRRT